MNYANKCKQINFHFLCVCSIRKTMYQAQVITWKCQQLSVVWYCQHTTNWKKKCFLIRMSVLEIFLLELI